MLGALRGRAELCTNSLAGTGGNCRAEPRLRLVTPATVKRTVPRDDILPRQAGDGYRSDLATTLSDPIVGWRLRQKRCWRRRWGLGCLLRRAIRRYLCRVRQAA